MYKALHLVVIVGLLLSSLPPAGSGVAFAANPGLTSTQPDSSSPPREFLTYLEPPDSQPLPRAVPSNIPTLYGAQAELQQSVGPYRTTVTIHGAADLARGKALGIKVLAATKDSATVVVDRLQLEKLAKLHFFPHATELISRLNARGGGKLPNTATVSDILAATATDSDGDGLNDTEEGWWCTDPNNADSDNDKVKDGPEVQALTDWLQHKATTRPASGKPFAGWPPDHAGCYDSDYDSVPDAVEVYMLGLNPNRESTARDKFDDGQKLFGLTDCPGSGGGCGYGALPRAVDWGVIFAEMPTWVKPPYDSPFVAAFPVPEVSVIPSSWKVDRVTTITTATGVMTETTNTYSATATRGESNSIANTVTWNKWEEVSQAVSQPFSGSAARAGMAAFSSGPNLTWNNVKMMGAGLATAATAGAGVAILGGAACIATTIICPVALVAGSALAVVGTQIFASGWDDAFSKDQSQEQNKTGTYSITNINNGHWSFSPEINASLNLNQSIDTQGIVSSLNGIQYSMNQQGALISRGLSDITYAISQPRLTETHTSGQSWGGAQTTTHTELEEHSITQGQAFATAQNWSTAWAVDSSHAADLTFTYSIKNTGSDYAREISGVIFNIYLGDDTNPIVSYPAWQQFPNGTLANVFPGDVYTFTSTPPVHLTLEQMRRIDLGEPLKVVLADFSYGDDQLYYQDAINSGLTIYTDDGEAAGDQLVHQYVLPTWGTESVQDVLSRFFPTATDSDGLVNSISTPESSPIAWRQHAASDMAWWHIYLTQDAGNTQLRDLGAQAGSALLFRFDRDSDRDGYPDRTELQYGTDPNDASSHPVPAVIAGYVSSRQGNTVTVKLALQNDGSFDAFGVQATMFSPDNSTTITDDIVGGNGVVSPATHISVGSLVKDPTLTNWVTSTAKPYATGNYSGSQDKTFTFSVNTPGVVGQGTTSLNWDDGAGNSGTLDLGASYHAPLPINVGSEGLQLGFDTGTLVPGESFTVTAYTPRDTFKFTVNSDPYATPQIVVTYSDMQGSHKFVTPVQLNSLAENLTPYSAQMLDNAGVDIITQGAVSPSGSNTTAFVLNNPTSETIQNANLYVDIVGNGSVVAHLPYSLTLQTGPTVFPVTWSTSSFSPAYDPNIDYLMLASWTDQQGNIIDTKARPFSTFAVDPSPILNTSPASWDFGTVTQGAQPQQHISIVNTGIMPLNVVVSPSDPSISLSGASGIISVPPAGNQDVVATLDTKNLSGAVNMSLTIRSNDPANQTATVNVTGSVMGPAGSANTFDVLNHPLDKTVRIYTSSTLPQFSAVDFTENIQPDTVSIEPCKIFDASGGTLKGVGKYCSDFAAGTVSYQIFGDGADGPLTVSTNPRVINSYSALNSTANSGATALNVASTVGFLANHEILIHQTQGTGAGAYEFATISSVGSGTLTLTKPISNGYTTGGNSHAQIVSVPHYTDVTIQNGAVLKALDWDGSKGGLVAFRASGIVTINGTITVSGSNGAPYPVGNIAGGAVGGGFRGGNMNNLFSDPTYYRQAFTGEGHTGPSLPQGTNNGNGGGGGLNAGEESGGGGGHAFPGEPNDGSGQHTGGVAVGDPNLATLFFGGGGGGASNDGGPSGVTAGSGGSGGGIIYVSGRFVTVNGAVSSNGGNGGNSNENSGGGGGAGGSILLRGETLALNANKITAAGGSGGTTAGSARGGNGSVGRIHLDYCGSLSGTTNPAASSQKLNCYLAQSTATSALFGDGVDGPLSVTTNPTIVNFYAAIASTTTAGSTTVNLASNPSSTLKSTEVLIHQTQGVNAGIWETGTIASLVGTTLTLQNPLVNTYTQGGSSHAQVVFVPHYTDVAVQSGGVLTAPAWNGSTGGIVAFRATGTMVVQAGGTAKAVGIGYRGGTANNSGDNTYSGEGTVGPPVLRLRTANGNGGGSAYLGQGEASGGGNGTPGVNGNMGSGGSAAGTADLTNAVFGGGGGGYSRAEGSAPGGNGGGIIFAFAAQVNITGGMDASGQVGGSSSGGSGAGGAGGSVLITGRTVTLGSGLAVAAGANGGIAGYDPSNTTGQPGGVGRIRVEYCDSLSGTTAPSASVAQILCSIAQKPDATTVHFTIPDQVNAPGLNYLFQFGRHFSFGIAGGNVVTPTQIIAKSYTAATMDALVTNTGPGGVSNLNITLGGTSIFSTTQPITQPTTINIPNFASALNSYLNGQSIGSTVDVPFGVTVNNQSDVILTNLALTPGSGVDLEVGGGDLQLLCTGGVSCLTNPPSEGDVITPTVQIHNNGNQPASSAVVGYYAGDPNGGGKLLGNSYVATITPGGVVTATLVWNTTGYTHTQSIYAFVDPSNSIAEDIETNNIISQTLYIKTKPDLRVASVAFDHTDRVVGEAIKVTGTISNTGETNAPASTTHLDVLGQQGDTLTQNLPTGGIAATNTITISTTIAPAVFGSHVITLTADSGAVVNESLESNNAMTATLHVGLNPPDIDAGGSSDTAYNPASGFGYLNGSTYDFSGTGVVTKTVRYDGNGDVQYRFDGLQPGRFYHLDGTFYEEGGTFTQTIKFNGIDSGVVIPLNDGQASTTSVLVPPAAYVGTTMVVDIVRPNTGGIGAPTRFKTAASPSGPAFVSELHLSPIEYTYIDAAGTGDAVYDSSRGYGYTGNNTFASTLGGSDALSTYRSAFTGNVLYEFSGLDANKEYLADLTLYDGAGSTRQETVLAGNTALTGCQDLPVNGVQRVQCPIPQSQYAIQGIVFISVECVNCTSPRVNEIALEQKTGSVTGALPTPTPTATATSAPTITPTPTTNIQTVVTSFAAQWSGSWVRLTWATTSENKTDQFQIDRATSITGTWQIAVVTQPSLSNCAALTNPAAYSVFDVGAPAGQTVYYRLSWTGTSCGGASGGSFPAVASAVPVTATPTDTPTNTPTVTATSTLTGTLTETPTTTPTDTPISTPSYTPTHAPSPTPCNVVPAKPVLKSPANNSTVNTLQVVLDWSDVNCATGYDVLARIGSATGKVVGIRTGLPVSQYTTPNLVAGKTFYWQVRACDAIGCSPWTSYWHFKVSATAKTVAIAGGGGDDFGAWLLWLFPIGLIGGWVVRREF
jgi:CARDB